MNAPVKQCNDSEGLRFFCRHLVGLCVTYHYTNGSEADQLPRFAAYSGTLINIGGAVCFLTAGHVLQELEEYFAGDQVEITTTVLADTFGQHSVSNHPIPFDLKGARLFYIDDREEGLDFGVIVLDPHYVRLLSKNGMVALEEKNWIHQFEVRFDGYAMLGFPAEFSSKRLSESGAGEVSPTMFSVKRLDGPPEDRAPTRHPQFVGQVSSELPLKSVVGMSGGPIFGFRLEPETRYWVVALQSSWDAGRRTVYGCSLPALASLLTSWITE
jgi:hypothetical protein